ncbi:MAG: FHA domain-containing protein [Alphaproteobacteria bacterium]|nr:FHA domain-containing protein [Alphaproteobacteria bacterium]
MGQDQKSQPGQRSGFLGTLKDALAAASRDDTGRSTPGSKADGGELTPVGEPIQLPPPIPEKGDTAVSDVDLSRSDGPAMEDGAEAQATPAATGRATGLSAADAAKAARGGTLVTPEAAHVEQVVETTRVAKDMVAKAEDSSRTQLVRGKVEVARGDFERDPVVGWLVVVGGPGIGAFRPIYEGNNSIGRSLTQRIPVDFGDDAISSEEQAFIRYDSSDRSFLFVPNLSKTNVVTVDNARPTGAVELSAMNVIVMGRTQLVFVPFCGSDFDWSEIAEK